MTNEGCGRSLVSQARRIVVKVGSGVLTGKDGLSGSVIGRLTAQISEIKGQGREVVLVSSGAIASGFKKVGLTSRPTNIPEKQACAAVGQAGLMMTYERSFARRGYKVAQLLLTADDLSNRRRYLNARNTMTTLLKWGIIPIVNENDTVVVKEIKFGDNDTLSGMVATLIEADLLINLTDIDGLYDRDPRLDSTARLLTEVSQVDGRIEDMASRIPGALGAGGMHTKVVAARRVTKQGMPCVIANGRRGGILLDILAGREVGTLFLPRPGRLSQRKHWIAFTAKSKGQVTIDSGARKALLERGKSLLPSGVKGFEGRFGQGDTIKVLDGEGTLVAVGLTNYSSEEIKLIAGHHTSEIQDLLGYWHSDEIIHRDNMVVGDRLNI